jgi:hypothetical protein
MNIIDQPTYFQYANIPPQRSSGVLDIPEFMDLLHYVIIVLHGGILFRPAYPEDVLSDDGNIIGIHKPKYKWDGIICYQLIERLPGSLRGEPRQTGRNRVVERKPRLRETLPTSDPLWYKNLPAQPGGVYPSGWFEDFDEAIGTDAIEIYGQSMDNLIQFDIFAKTNYDAERLTNWFETTLELHTGLFIDAGIKKMAYAGRVKDPNLYRWKSDIRARSVRWDIVTERLFYKSIPKIRSFSIALQGIMSEVIPQIWEIEEREQAEDLRDRFLQYLRTGQYPVPLPSGVGVPYTTNINI